MINLSKNQKILISVGAVLLVCLILLIVFLTRKSSDNTLSDNTLSDNSKDNNSAPSMMRALQAFTSTNPQPTFMLTDSNGNISIFDPMSSNLNSDWKINGKLCISGQCANENDIKTPVGTILPFAGNTVPQSYLFCDGSAVSRTTYADLFSVIGTTYGTGDGSTTFNLPDLRGRTVVGVGTGTGLTNRTLGQKDGVESVTLTGSQMPSHTHTGSGNTDIQGSHSHFTEFPNNWGDRNSANVLWQENTDSSQITRYSTNETGNHSHSFSFTTNSSGGNQPHTNMQPFIGLNYIIKSN